MKTYVLMFAFLFSAALCAQDNKPIFEKAGDMVKATYYHDNGMVAQQGYFLNEELHEEWNMFNDKGQLIAKGNYQMGKRTGKWFFYNQEGVKEVDYKDNKIVNVVKHNSAESIVVN